MIVSIHQPAYLPWLGYFHSIAASDLHIVLDHVQFEKNSFINRNKVCTPNGWTWLTIPVKTKGRFEQLSLATVEVANDRKWHQHHWKTLSQSYAKAPDFAKHQSFFQAVYDREWQYLTDICRETTRYILDALGITTPIMFSSEMDPHQQKDELVLELCQKAGATTYLSGALGKQYLRECLFQESGIQVVYQEYHHPEYPQVHQADFQAHMSVLDLLFNCGPRSLDIIMSGQEQVAP